MNNESHELWLMNIFQSIIVKLYCNIKSISCVNVAQMMVATDKLSVLRINWEGFEERDYSLDLRRIPFSINQQVHYGETIVQAVIKLAMVIFDLGFLEKFDCETLEMSFVTSHEESAFCKSLEASICID